MNNNKSSGLDIKLNNNELIIKGSSSDLIELANYIINIAHSDTEKDHIHIDDLTLINECSEISSLIIEKE